MKALVVSLLLLALLVAPVQAATLSGPSPLTVDEAQYYAAAVGCKDVDIHIGNGSLNGGFVPKGTYQSWIFVVTFEKDTIMIFQGDNPTWARFVLLHELAHCLDHQTGRVTMAQYRDSENWPWIEWGADAQAVVWAERFGLDTTANVQALSSLLRNDPDAGDATGPHGSSTQRILFNEWQVRRLAPRHEGA